MAKVLVTGADGFIGRNALLPLVNGGHEVHAVSCVEAPYPPEGRQCVWHVCDLLNPHERSELIAGVKPDRLLHFAWCTAPGEYWSSPENLRWVGASLEMVLDFREAGGRRLVIAGSCAEYDWSGGHCSEATTPTRPATLYGVCKNGLHRIVERYCEESGLSYGWGRTFFVFGPHENPARFVPSLVLSLLREEPFTCRQGEHVRDFLCAREVGEAFVRLLESEVRGPVNIASGRPVTLRELATRVAEELGRPELVGFGDPGAPTREPPTLTADVERLTREVGWAPAGNRDACLRETIEWWRSNMAGERHER